MRYAGSKYIGAGEAVGACVCGDSVKLAVKRGGDIAVITSRGEVRYATDVALVMPNGVLNYNGEFNYVSDDGI